MMLTFHTEGPPCSCGLRPRGVEVASVRVNKLTLRTTGYSVGAMPWRCSECRLPLEQVVQRMWLDPGDAAKVTAYRARRWPEVAS